MKCIQASKVDEVALQRFLDANQAIKQASLVENGYVVEWHGKIIGCFELETVEHSVYWLKQLYIIRNEAGKLPVLLECILHFAKEKDAKIVYAHSEQPVTDLLLHSLQFSLQTGQLDTLKSKMKKGNWWSYQVS